MFSLYNILMINNDEIRFEHYNGMHVQQDKKLLQTIKLMLLTRNMDLNITNYLDEDSDIFFMYKNNKLAGFAWITICKELDMCELSWFVSIQKRVAGLESKALLDHVINYCKKNGIHELVFNCIDSSWGRIKDKKKLFEKFGYNLNNDNDFDLCINTEDNNLTI